MNQTMSSSSEWMHFYNQSFPGQPVHPPGHHLTSSPIFGGGGAVGTSTDSGDRVISDATVVTTAVPTTTNANPLGSGNSSPTAATNLSPEGRVSKPARKRSRASRRTPTTLLNTDTANFRAMVQQFTGGPSAPFGSVSHPGGVSFGFGGGGGGGIRQNFINPLMVPGGFQLQQQQQQQQVFHQLQQQNQGQGQGQVQGQGGQYLQFGLSNGSNTPAVDGFLQRLSSGGRAGNVNGGGGGGGVNTAEGFMNMEHGVSAARPSNGSNENRSNSSFMF